MKNNKPLLFINSAQTTNFTNHNQYVFDSRYDNNEKIVQNEAIKFVPKLKEKKIVQKEETVIKAEHEKSVRIDEKDKHLEKLYNKIELLDKRAKLGRYVLVSIEIDEEKIEGYFKAWRERDILLIVDEEEKEIVIEKIKNIHILKV